MDPVAARVAPTGIVGFYRRPRPSPERCGDQSSGDRANDCPLLAKSLTVRSWAELRHSAG